MFSQAKEKSNLFCRYNTNKHSINHLDMVKIAPSHSVVLILFFIEFNVRKTSLSRYSKLLFCILKVCGYKKTTNKQQTIIGTSPHDQLL